MAYTKQTWVDGQAGGTPLSAARLGHIEDGVEAAAAGADAAAAQLQAYEAAADPHSGYVAHSVVSAKGELLAATGPGTVARVPAGADGQVLAADAGQPAGVAWTALTAADVGADAAGAATAAQAAAKSYTDDAIAALARPWVFNVNDYGAAGDGVTDDTQAFRDAIAAAVAYAQAGAGAAEVFVPVPAAEYLIAGAPVQNGTHNTQIPIPVVPMGGNKVVLRIRGAVDASAMPIWTQTVRQRSGAVLRSTAAATDTSGTIGEASVLGGPTPQQGFGSSAAVFSNIHVIVEGVQIQVPNTARGADVSGIDLRGCAEATVRHCAVLVDQPPTSITPGQGSGWAFGVAMPWPGNNDLCIVDDVSVQGFTYGFHLTEHVSAPALRAIYCFTGATVIGSFESSSGSQHIAWLGNFSCEACTNGLQFVQGGKAVCAVMSVEGDFAGGQHIADTNGLGSGYVGLGGIINTIKVADPTNVRVIYLDGTSGAVAAPAIPPSGTALRNPFWRDCAVAISGGTVTAVSVDGQATGVVSGTVIVPSGRTITLTYSAAPTWTWVRL